MEAEWDMSSQVERVRKFDMFSTQQIFFIFNYLLTVLKFKEAMLFYWPTYDSLGLFENNLKACVTIAFPLSTKTFYCCPISQEATLYCKSKIAPVLVIRFIFHIRK